MSNPTRRLALACAALLALAKPACADWPFRDWHYSALNTIEMDIGPAKVFIRHSINPLSAPFTLICGDRPDVGYYELEKAKEAAEDCADEIAKFGDDLAKSLADVSPPPEP